MSIKISHFSLMYLILREDFKGPGLRIPKQSQRHFKLNTFHPIRDSKHIRVNVNINTNVNLIINISKSELDFSITSLHAFFSISHR